MGKTASKQVVVAPTTFCASFLIQFEWETRRPAKRSLGPRARLRNNSAWSSGISNPWLARPSSMPSNGCLARPSLTCSTPDPAAPVTLLASVH